MELLALGMAILSEGLISSAEGGTPMDDTETHIPGLPTKAWQPDTDVSLSRKTWCFFRLLLCHQSDM